MKKIILLILMVSMSMQYAYTQAGIGIVTPHPSAQLDVTSSNKGVLVPRMLSSQRTSIPSPATGLLVYQTDNTVGFYYFDGSVWVYINSTGPAGPAGPAGPTGADGPIGPAGPQGDQGIQGPIGPQGIPGPAGPIGADGPIGPTGADGPIGPAGPQGATGPSGPLGPQGSTGPTGADGAIGAAGPQGIPGPVGPQGSQGIQGSIGPIGPTGDVGPIGPSGPQGVQGPFGPVGPQGSTGPTGADGAIGASGPQGPQGLQGPIGPQGIQGIQGDKGDQGDVGPRGPIGLLPNGSTAGNTPFWDGAQWVVNSSNLFNNGGGIGIGTTAPNASAKLEIESTTQGFLPPRMTTGQRDAIASPVVGLTIYNTTVNCLQWHNGTFWYDGCTSMALLAQYPTGSAFCASGPTAIVDVINPGTGKTWMDRNLGATQAATSSTDAASYGDLYQWGRGSDGHQCRTSATTATLSSTDQPGNDNFITVNSSPFDWRSPQNDNLWQGVNGINNPCPSGYRLPTSAELDGERMSWSSNNTAGAFASPLKLSMAGNRFRSNGSLSNVGTDGYYWGSTVSGTETRILYFSSSFAAMSTFNRANGFSVRCLKN